MRGYEISEEVKSEGVDYKNFLPGINENIVLIGVSYGLASPKADADPDGPKALIFEFQSEDGETKYRHTEWEIVESRELQNAEKLYDALVAKNETPSESKAEFVNKTVDKSYMSQQKRIKHIMTKFMAEDEAIIPASNSFAQFATLVAQVVNPHLDSTKKLRAIFVYDNKGYLKFPSFVPFLETQGSEPTGLKINPRYHKITPPAPTGASAAVGNSKPSDEDEF